LELLWGFELPAELLLGDLYEEHLKHHSCHLIASASMIILNHVMHKSEKQFLGEKKGMGSEHWRRWWDPAVRKRKGAFYVQILTC
jgi:hypothetical protein